MPRTLTSSIILSFYPHSANNGCLMIWPGGCGWTRSDSSLGWTTIMTSFRSGARRSAELMQQTDGVIVCSVPGSTPGHEHGMAIHRENHKTDHPRLLSALLPESVPQNYCFQSLCSRCGICWSNRAWQKKKKPTNKTGWWSPPPRHVSRKDDGNNHC